MGIISGETEFTRTRRITRITVPRWVDDLEVIASDPPRLIEDKVDDRRRHREIGGGPAISGTMSIVRARCWSDTNWSSLLSVNSISLEPPQHPTNPQNSTPFYPPASSFLSFLSLLAYGYGASLTIPSFPS